MISNYMEQNVNIFLDLFLRGWAPIHVMEPCERDQTTGESGGSIQNECNSHMMPSRSQALLSSWPQTLSLKLSSGCNAFLYPRIYPSFREKEKKHAKEQKSRKMSCRICFLCKSLSWCLPPHTDIIIQLYWHGQCHNAPTPTPAVTDTRKTSILMMHTKLVASIRKKTDGMLGGSN